MEVPRYEQGGEDRDDRPQTVRPTQVFQDPDTAYRSVTGLVGRGTVVQGPSSSTKGREGSVRDKNSVTGNLSRGSGRVPQGDRGDLPSPSF